MRKFISILCLSLALCLLLTACSGGADPVPEDTDGDPVVTLESNAVSLLIGETYTIAYTVTPEMQVEFVSSDSGVAAVDASGVVTAIANGTASIAVSAGDYSKGYLNVTVSTPSMAAIPNLIMDRSSVELFTGSEYDLSAEIRVGRDFADAALTWSSDAPEVVSVSDGKIAALAEGTAVVTASAEVNGVPVTASCEVTVYDHYSILLSVSSLNAPLNGVVSVNAQITDDSGNPVTPEDGELEYYSTTPESVRISGNEFTILNSASPTVGVRYKGNIQTVPIEVYSIKASVFTDSCTDYFGTVDGVTFCGVYFHSNTYQPYIWMTAEGIAEIKAYAEENGYTKLRIHAWSGLFDNAFLLNGKYYLPKDAWGSCEVPISELTEDFSFWSQSQGETNIYMWFDFQ